MAWHLVSYSFAALCAGLAIWNLIVMKRAQAVPPAVGTPTPGFNSDERAAIEEIDRLQKKIAALCQKVELLEEHAGEYFYVLHDNGWMKVIELLEQLDAVSADITRLVQEDAFDKALELSRYLATAGTPWSEALAKSSSTDLKPLVDWERLVDEIILTTASALGAAAEHTKKLGIDRGRKRKPTLMAVDEIMKLLDKRRGEKSNIEDW
jgi:hypothetical protein